MGELGFRRAWRAEVLERAPLIAPARRYVYPRAVVGEEDAMARGALELLVRADGGGSFLATCALGFRGAEVPTGVWGCPRAEEMCAVAGGYAYVIDTGRPEVSTHVEMRPVVTVLEEVDAGVLVFVGFHTVAAWGVDGMAWETGRLSWEGLRLDAVQDGVLRGWGWDVMSDREVAFRVDLRTGEHEGGAFGRSTAAGRGGTAQ